MKFLGTWVLAVLAVALGLYVYFFEIKKAEKDEEKKAAEEKVLDFDSAKVTQIAIKNSKGEFTLEKDGNSWKLTKPVVDKADDSGVTSLLSSISSEKFEDTVEGEDLKGFGLDNPQISVTLTLQGGGTKKLNVGAEAAIPGKIYLQRNDEKKVLYTSSGIKFQLDKSQKDLRDKKIFRKDKGDVQHVGIQINTKENRAEINLTKKDSDWFMDGSSERIDPDAATALLTGLENFRATDFPSENAGDKAELKKDQLNTPALKISVEGKDKAILANITVSPKVNNNVFVTLEGSPSIYQAFGSNIDVFMKKPSDYRDKKKPFDFKKDDVAEIIAKNSMTEVHLVKKGSSWEMPLPDTTKQVSQIQVASLMDKMSALKVAEYLDGEKPKGLNPALGQVTLKDAKGEILIDMSWGVRTKNQRNTYAQSNKYKGTMSVEGSSVDTMPVQTLIENKGAPSPPPAMGSTLKGPPRPGPSLHP